MLLGPFVLVTWTPDADISFRPEVVYKGNNIS
jgi:hypothetical protein